MNEVKDYQSAINDLQFSLNSFDQQVIGIAKIHGLTEMILEVDKKNDSLVTFRIGNLGGSSTSHYKLSAFKQCVFLFPMKQNLAEMKENVTAFHNFCQLHKL